MKILIICTGNTCRSQMAEGILKEISHDVEIYSAGTNAEGKVNPFAVKAMSEIGIDISNQLSEPISDYLDKSFDYVVTVCDGAKASCPVFTGSVEQRLHMGFEDPAEARGTEEEVMPVYRRIRDEIKERFSDWYLSIQPDESN